MKIGKRICLCMMIVLVMTAGLTLYVSASVQDKEEIGRMSSDEAASFDNGNDNNAVAGQVGEEAGSSQSNNIPQAQEPGNDEQKGNNAAAAGTALAGAVGIGVLGRKLINSAGQKEKDAKFSTVGTSHPGWFSDATGIETPEFIQKMNPFNPRPADSGSHISFGSNTVASMKNSTGYTLNILTRRNSADEWQPFQLVPGMTAISKGDAWYSTGSSGNVEIGPFVRFDTRFGQKEYKLQDRTINEFFDNNGYIDLSLIRTEQDYRYFQ